MKEVSLFFFISMLLASVLSTAQTKLSPEQETFFNKLMSGKNARHVNWVKTTAAEINAKNLAEEDIRKRTTRYAGQGIKEQQDIGALISLVMMQCAKDQQQISYQSWRNEIPERIEREAEKHDCNCK
jgi:hypothetical protein